MLIRPHGPDEEGFHATLYGRNRWKVNHDEVRAITEIDPEEWEKEILPFAAESVAATMGYRPGAREVYAIAEYFPGTEFIDDPYEAPEPGVVN